MAAFQGAIMLEYDRKKLGEHLKDVRESMNYTQSEVAQRLGYSSPQFISNIERGISVAPLDTLAKMIKMYKTDPAVTMEIIMESQRELLTTKLRGKASKKSKRRH